LSEIIPFHFTPYALPPLLGYLVLIVLSYLVLSRGENGSHRAFAILNLAVAAWNLHIFLLYTIIDEPMVSLLDRLFQPVLVVIPLAWVNFITLFCRSRYRKPILGIYLAVSLLLLPLSLTEYFIRETRETYFGFYGEAGPLYPVFLLLHLSALAVTTALLVERYRNTADAVHKNQIRYILPANVVMGILSAHNFFPLYGLEQYPLGNIAVIAYLSFVGLAVTRHRFMDLETLVRRGLIYSIATFLLTALYLLLILLLEGLVRIYLLPDSLVVPLLPVLVVAFLFQGVKERVQSRLDAVFGRERKLTALLSAFSRSALASTRRAELAEHFQRTVEKGVGPLSQCFFTRDPEGRWRSELSDFLSREDLDFILEKFLPAAVGDSGEILDMSGPKRIQGCETGSRRKRILKMGFLLLVPFRGRTATGGAALLGPKASGGPFTTEEIAFIGALAGQVASFLEAREYYERWRREEKFTALGRASATISHEIRNPLSVIKGAVLYLKSRHSEGDISRFAGIVGEEVEKTSLFIDRFLSASRIPPARLVRSEVRELLRGLVPEWEREFPDIEVSVDDPGTEVWWPIDPMLIRRSLENLFRNAAEAMNGRGRVVLSLAVEGGNGSGTGVPSGAPPLPRKMVLALSDTGPGVRSEVRDFIFDPFYTTREKGTGLGLCVVDSVVRAHGGRLEMDSPPGGGASFRIILPAASR
jgi:signal transduction histidine kinase